MKEVPLNAAEVGEAHGGSPPHEGSAPAGSANEGEVIRSGDVMLKEEGGNNLTIEGRNPGENAFALIERKSLDRKGRKSSIFLKLLPLLLLGLVLIAKRKIIFGAIMYLTSSGDDDDTLARRRVLPAVTMKGLLQSEEQFKAAASDFQAAWQASSPIVKKAFTKYFVPSNKDDEEPTVDPLALYNRHINGMLGAPRPDATDVNALQDHNLNLLLLRGVCGAAAEILKKLRNLEVLHAETGVPVPVLGLGEPICLPPLEELMEQETDGVTAPEFSRQFGIVVKAKGETSRVPKLLADSLRDLLYEGQTLASIYDVRQKFEPFLTFQGLGNGRLPDREYPKMRIRYSGEQFDVAGFFLHAFLDVEGRSAVEQLSRFIQTTVIRQWCTKRAIAFVMEQQSNATHSLKRELDRKRAYMRGITNSGEETMDPESLQAIARFVL
ncbi:hypothetical protein, conserved [Eimeria acervulina]|uniref:Uncharacterized protein n=1 Tax=Eimeria acervulina TaxID=5801 RepID=U6GKA3_EIMAC|nr:hypothetical protein, conserved [Eimeria acervulina]CDI80661.1 hypothetical protein, conserved [Eimeria acervulina]